MSLISHLDDKNSPINQFIRAQFPNTRAFLADARKKVRATDSIVPDKDVPWGVIGTALDYRIRYYFGITSHEELVAYSGARMLTDAQIVATPVQLSAKWTGNTDDSIVVFDNHTGKMIFITRPPNHNHNDGLNWGQVDNDVLSEAHLLVDRVKSGEVTYDDKPIPLKREYQGFFDSLDSLLECNSPIETKLAESQEDDINRYCIVLALMESVYRAGPKEGNPLVGHEFGDTNALLGIAQSHWLDDLRELSWKFYDNCIYLLYLSHVLNPNFDGSIDVGGADADLIVGDMLIDIKTSKRPTIDLKWLRQLLGYMLLDYSDHHEISSIGLYMARQGILVSWSLEEVVKGLCADNTTSIKELREQFQECVKDFQATQWDII